MTKNNLKPHLRWLIDRGQPELSSVDVLLTRSGAHANAQPPQQPYPREQLRNTKDEQETIDTKNEDLELKYDKDGDCLLQDASMARLNLSSSASKPRMLSLGAADSGDSTRPKTPSSSHRNDIEAWGARFGDGHESGALTYSFSTIWSFG